MFTIGQACTYTPNGMSCLVLRVYPDRHRARIKVSETGHEIDEVAWHDLVSSEVPVVQAPTPAPTTSAPRPETGEARAVEVEPEAPRAQVSRPRWFKGAEEEEEEEESP